jgi:phosphomannomutase
MERGSHLPSGERGDLSEFNPREDYFARIFALVNPKEIKPLKVVFDAGNGMAMTTFDELLTKLPVQVEKMYFNPDGNFPNHEANPLKTETLRDLQRKVRETGADFGFATDGDADRIGLVDETGEIVPASFAGAMVGMEILKQKRSGLMLYDPRVSHSVRELWEQNGATTDMCKVGHANIKKMMKEQKAIFATELSLHLYYGDVYDLESPELSFLYFARILSTSGKKLSELWKPMQTHFHSGEINFRVEDREAVMERLREKFADAKISTLDGFLFEYPDCWISMRMSNTEPLIRLVAEADTAELLAEKIAEVEGEIKGV